MASLKRYEHDLYADVAKIKRALSDTRGGVQDLLGDTYHQCVDLIKDKSIESKENFEDLVAKNPLTAILTSILAGFALGVILKKRR